MSPWQPVYYCLRRLGRGVKFKDSSEQCGAKNSTPLNPFQIVLIFRWFPSSSLETHDVGAFKTTFPSWRWGMGKQEK